ncbi:sugar porter family MFS transporter [Amycolatopsis sp. FDAARGOS 1241]|uniref:sugar porter family MFS transporter n=1 Tax=Amycolatopsis sp. FDAARGOS 1241 TaxID=2778070 RepID=UPI00194E44E8|nr:sugar porter family MFS transporter [Amycolatopsis sp. FDAARGOS 1241]QRP44842.1 sugar porter family MFS transporter [Amycolatopsis sp. FDAARGOS 1241]
MTQTAAARRPINRITLYFFGALGGILFGYDLGVISGVLPFIGKTWNLTGWDKGVITASISVGAIFGALFSSRINEKLGRRRTIMVAAVIVIIGTIAASVSPTFVLLTISRLVIGVGIGLSSSTVPTYLSELAPARLRGAMGALNQIFIVLGILIAFLVSYGLGSSGNWRLMFAGAIVPALILLVGLVFLPETPRWLLANGHEEQARSVLRSSHGTGVNVDEEIGTIREVIRLDTESAKTRFRDLWAPMVRPMLVVALLLAVGQQFSGVNAVNAYFPTMLIGLGFATQAALLSGVLLGITKFLFTAWVVFVVDRWGRKPLLLIGNVLMVITLVAAGFIVLEVNDTTTKGILMLVAMVLYLVGYELGWGAVVWVMMAEVFPLKVRAAGMGISSVVLWAATGLISAIFPIISDPGALGLGGSMFLFAGINVVLFGLTKWLVPETKGRTLEQIELDLRGRHGARAKAEAA